MSVRRSRPWRRKISSPHGCAVEDQGGLQTASRCVRSRAWRCGRARRCCTITRRTTSPSIFRSARAISKRASRAPISWSSRITIRRPSSMPISSRKPGLGYVDHDGVVTIISPSQNITHHRHMLGEDHRQADQQSALHHVAGRWRLRRQGRHDLSGHAGPDGDEDASAGAAGLHA